MLDLDDDALGLIRAARGGDEPSAEERARALQSFRAERSELQQPPVLPVRRLPVRSRRWTLTWSIAAFVSLASAGAFADWHAVARQVRAIGEWPSRLFREADVEVDSAPRAGSARATATGVWTESSIALNPQPEVPSVGYPALLPSALPLSAGVPSAGAPSAEVLRPEPAVARVAPAAPPVRSAAALADELALIASARDALASHDHARALELTREHARRFAKGALLEERRAIEALAHCRSGRGDALGLAFVQQWPDSLFTPRIKRDCAAKNSVPSAALPGTDSMGDDASRPRKELTP